MQPILQSVEVAGSVGTFDFVTGTSGNDTLSGTAGHDEISASEGGDDLILAKGGDDTIVMGAALTAADSIDGGSGEDGLYLTGDYSALLTFAPTTLVDVESITVGDGFSYNLAFNDANIAAGEALTVFATFLGGTDQLTIDGSAETDGNIRIYFSDNRSNLTGGAGNDLFWAQAGLNPADHIRGGEGLDQLWLTGTAYAFGAHQMTGIELLQPTGDSCQITMANGNVAGHDTMNVFANQSGTLVFDGSAETGGAFNVAGSPDADTIIGGRGSDTITGGQGADRIVGGGGGDILTSGPADDGTDVFVYQSVADSSRKAPDHVALTLEDIVDLSAIDARTDKTGDQAFRMVAAFDGHAGELVVMAFDPANNVTVVAGDVDGDGRADLVIDLVGDRHAFTGFVL